FQIVGDAFCVAFSTAEDALLAAVDAQRALMAEPWGETPVRVRMGLHTGTAHSAGSADGSSGYVGYSTMARVQRVMSTAHGGQILVSNTSADLLQADLPADVALRDMETHRLKGLANPVRLWQVEAPGLMVDFPALQTLNGIPNNLPIQVTSFIGREKETQDIQSLLERHRLVTLTGPGGIGKTRLSLQAGSMLLDSFTDGVWHVELEALTETDLVLPTVAGALGLREQEGQSLLATLQNHARTKTALLVLDNCEHLLDACARLADALLRSCPQVRILATSREALGIAGEALYRVPTLGLPDPQHLPPPDRLSQYDSVKLFIERAVAVKSDFSVTNANAPAVAQVCSRLDGIPLAIELAAARVRGLTPEQISQRLDDRFHLLTGGSRTALPRQQTLRAMIEWSYDLLSDSERCLLRRLSVFQGAWTLEAAEAVCADLSESVRTARPQEGQPGVPAAELLELLLRLVDKSLLVAPDQAEQARYRMLETIHQFAAEQLAEAGEERAMRLSHLEFFLRFSESLQPELQSPQQLSGLRMMDTEYENLRSALEWAAANPNGQPGLRLARATEQQADVQSVIGIGARSVRQYQSALDWLKQADAPDPDMQARLHAKIVERVSYFKWHLEPEEYGVLLQVAVESRQALEAALRASEGLPPSRERLRLLLALADSHNLPKLRDLDQMEKYARLAVQLAEQLGTPDELASALRRMSEMLWWRGQWRESAQVQLRRMAIIRQLPGLAAHERAKALVDTGYVLTDVGEYSQAMPFLLEGHDLCAELQLGEIEIGALQERIHCLLRLDRWDEALELEPRLREIQRSYPREQVGGACMSVAYLATIHALRGGTDAARDRREEAAGIMLKLGGPVDEWIWRQHY
ncbi:MAG TPA: AAA family ATPase, partial [Anaerolineales bacterium]|nr:AAA family ATPase [Anaerolineales bacterium]